MTTPEPQPTRLAVMLSGGGRTLANLLDRAEAGTLPAEVALVLASRPCGGLERAKARGIPTLLLPGRIEAGTLDQHLREHRIALVVLAGYLQLVDVPPAYRGRVVNIHPALLPEFGGLGMYGDRVHRAVLEAGRAESGCTVHLVDEQYDRGPILLQRRCPVRPDDTPETLAARVFEQECVAYPEAIARLAAEHPTPPREGETP